MRAREHVNETTVLDEQRVKRNRIRYVCFVDYLLFFYFLFRLDNLTPTISWSIYLYLCIVISKLIEPNAVLTDLYLSNQVHFNQYFVERFSGDTNEIIRYEQ